MTTDTLGDALPREMTRVRDKIMPLYLELGVAGRPGLFLMQQSLDAAQRALADGNVVAMLRAYEDLKGYEA